MEMNSGKIIFRMQRTLDLVANVALDMDEELIIAADWLQMSDYQLDIFCHCLVKKGKTGLQFDPHFREYQIKSGKDEEYLLVNFIEEIMLEFGFAVRPNV